MVIYVSIQTLLEHQNILQIFQNSLSTLLMRRLIPLQECEACQRVTDGHEASKEVIQQVGRRKRTSNHASSADLRALLRPLKHRTRALPSYITYKKLGNGEFIECKASDLDFLTDADIQEELFTKV